MRSGSESAGTRRCLLGLLFGLSFISNAYFLANFGSPNSISRAALSVALIEHGTVAIDPLADLAEDRAVRDGHSYSDKAPGMSFLALPVAAVFIALVNPRHDDRLWHGEGRISVALGALIAVSALLISSLLTAISVPLLYRATSQLGGSAACAAVIALVYAHATPIWLWAAAFYGHSVAAALLVTGMHALLRMASGGPYSQRWALWSGFSLGWAVLVEFTAAVPVLILLAFALTRLAESGRLWRSMCLVALGGLPALCLLLAYNAAAFGGPFSIGYAYSHGYDAMQSGFYGLSAPSLSVLAEITLGDRDGILWLSPVLALVPIGLALSLLSSQWRSIGALCGSVVAYYFLLNSGYAYWDGGYSTGPRHVTASMPFACLLLACLWERGRVARYALLGLGSLSGLFCLIAVAVNIAMPNDLDLSMAEFLLPRFWQGQFDNGVANLLGQLGWTRLTPLLPLLIVWVLGLVALIRLIKLEAGEIPTMLPRGIPAGGGSGTIGSNR